MAYFTELINGQVKQKKFSKEEYAVYQQVSMLTWGAMPLDVSWAINTDIYQRKKTILKL